MNAAGNPLFGAIPIGRKKRGVIDESELEFLRQKLIRTGRDRQETAKLRQVIDQAFEHVVKKARRQSNINEQSSSDMQSIKEEIFLEIAQRLEQLNENEIQVESTSSTSTSVTSVTTTTPSPNSPTKAATLLNFVVDQGPGAVGVGVASLMYAAMSSLPYWLPAFAAGKKRRRKRHDYDHRF